MRYAALGLLILAAGCASIPGGVLLQGLIGSHISCEMPAEMPFPDAMTLDLGAMGGGSMKAGNAILSALGGGTIEEQLGKAVKNSGLGFRKIAADAFRSQLREAKLFGAVVDKGGNVGMSLGVSRWGLAYNAASRRVEPVLDIQATLSVPGFGTVWQGARSIADLSRDAAAVIGKVDVASLVSRPQGLAEIMNVASKDLSKQLYEDLRKNPPQLPRL